MPRGDARRSRRSRSGPAAARPRPRAPPALRGRREARVRTARRAQSAQHRAAQARQRRRPGDAPVRLGSRPMELHGKTALLTGATGGLGRAIAEALAERGATLVLSSRKGRRARRARRPRCRATATARSSATSPRRARRCGCSRPPARSTSWSPTPGCRPRAGSTASARRRSGGRCGSTSSRRCGWRASCVPRFVERGSGHLVFVSSISGKAATARASLYCGDEVRPPRLRPLPARGPARRPASASR